jgi:GrpB-like predicted nucleotidyltransferase (UPF0157 family)
MNKYKFRKYKNNYPRLYEKEKRKLEKIIPHAAIEHVGSTSIEGLGGKGVVDILISVPKKDIKKIRDKLIIAKYALSKTGGSRDRIFFSKDYGLFIKRRVHLSLTYINSKIYKDAIKFREALRKDKKLRDKYSSIKQEAISLGKKSKDYREHKAGFIKGVLKR